jgi:hypothetical protein
MFPLVEFPELVRHYAPFFKDVFSATAFIEFERYISGLIVSDLRQDIGWDQPAVCSGKPQSEFTQPAFCRFLDQSLKLPYVGTLAGSDKVNLKTGQEPLEDFATRLKQEHLERLQKGGQPIFQRITTRYM